MGTSIRSGRPITQELWSRVPATFTLALAALFIETILGVLFGIYSAVHAGKLQDRAIRLFCVILASLPAFVLSLLFLFYLLFGFIGMKLAAKWSGADCGCLQLH